MRSVSLIALLAALIAPLSAQRVSFAPSHFRGHESNFTRFNHAHPGDIFFPLGFSDGFYSDYLSHGYPVASAPPVIVMQSPAQPPAPIAVTAPVRPLMIELQGDRYVQVSGDEDSTVQMIDRIPDQPLRRLDASGNPSQKKKDVSATVLVFRDGHREEVSGYTIADGKLYAAADYYKAGSWTRKIELAALNLPETESANQSRGTQFRLPEAPNEVTVGP